MIVKDQYDILNNLIGAISKLVATVTFQQEMIDILNRRVEMLEQWKEDKC